MNLLHKIAQEAKVMSLKSSKKNHKRPRVNPPISSLSKEQLNKFNQQAQKKMNVKPQFKKHYHFQDSYITQSVSRKRIKSHNHKNQNWGGFTY